MPGPNQISYADKILSTGGGTHPEQWRFGDGNEVKNQHNATDDRLEDHVTGAADKHNVDDLLDTASFVRMTVDERDKVDFLTVTQAVDLDALETRVNELDASVILMGTFAPSGGSFPGGGTAQAGESWIASDDGTIDGLDIKTNDRLIAINDNASTTLKADWHLADYSDAVQSFNSRVGAVVPVAGDYSADEVDYTVGDAGDWDVPPTDVAGGLDDLAGRVQSMEDLNSIILMGVFDASIGSFPSVTDAIGKTYRTTVAGTVDGVRFEIGDLLLAIVASPSTVSYSGNWLRINGKDAEVLSSQVSGQVITSGSSTITLDATYNNKILVCTNATSCTITVFNAASGFTLTVCRANGAGAVTITDDGTRNIYSVSGGAAADFVIDNENQLATVALLETNKFYCQ